MIRRAALTATAIALAVCACGDDDEEDAGDKLVRQGASASIVGDLVWVTGGTEGRAEELVTGEAFAPGSSWSTRSDSVAYDLDGAEVARVALGDDVGRVVEPAVADVGGRPLLVAGRCDDAGFGCNGETLPLVGWLDGPDLEPVDLGLAAAEGVPDLVGVAGGAAWLVVDVANSDDQRLVRVDAATGAVEVGDLPVNVWTGDVCAGPDGLIAAVAALNEGFVAVSIELFRRPFDTGAPWVPTGVLPMGERAPGAVRMFCAGAGEVVIDLREPLGPIAVRVDGATVVVEAPEPLRSADTVLASDPAGGLVAATVWDQAAPASVLGYTPGAGWVEAGEVRGSTTTAPVLGVSGGEIFEVGGAAVVAGVGAQPID